VTELRERMEKEIGKPVLPISAVTGAGLKELTAQLAAKLNPVSES
jgi:Fe2+ transport system protein B